MKKVVLAGGTGTLGQLFIDAFVAKGWEVVVLTRSKTLQNTRQVRYEYWDGEHLSEWVNSLEDADTVINLSGKSIQCRFTKENQVALHSSRILPTRALGNAIKQLKNKPKRWINFSGVSLFNGLKHVQDESSTIIGNGFLAELARDWEQAFFDFKFNEVQQVVLRVSPVLLRHSGFFAELLPLVRLGLGGKVGDGKQMMNWIHHTDLTRLLFWIIEGNKTGPIYHACSPKPISNKDFMKTFRKEVDISIGLPLPAFMARIGATLKGVDPSLLLDSVPVASVRPVEEGFVFDFPTAATALKDLIH